MTCIHATTGLCETCQADYDYDPVAYHEFGDHPEGIRRWLELQAEMAAHAAKHPAPTTEEMADWPF